MDDEDLADAAEAQKLETAQSFAGLGTDSSSQSANNDIIGLLTQGGHTMGHKLLQRMGWKQGQGIGPKVRRSARLGTATSQLDPGGTTHLFAPEDTELIQLIRKKDKKGLGLIDNGENLGHLGNRPTDKRAASDEDDGDIDTEPRSGSTGLSSTLMLRGRKKATPQRTGIGVGILNDDGSDGEDSFEVGPKIKYNKTLGGDKKKKKDKKLLAASNPKLRNTPVFLSNVARAGGSLRRCHDGRLPLDGFMLAIAPESFASVLIKYAPPPVPPGWKSTRGIGDGVGKSGYKSVNDVARESTLDPRSRAAALGEKVLPGKSVFDFLSPSVREKMITATGRQDLPPALGQIPAGFEPSAADQQAALWNDLPKLDKETATAAMIRITGGPYADNEAKKGRYLSYLQHSANPDSPRPTLSKGMTKEDFVREIKEFYNCARIFKPMTGFMASRFTTGKTSSTLNNNIDHSLTLLSKPEPKPADPAEEAARVGMYGQLTRSMEDFLPTRLLCKRFNVKPPAHSHPENEGEGDPKKPAEIEAAPEFHDAAVLSAIPAAQDSEQELNGTEDGIRSAIDVNPERNAAIEQQAAQEGVLKAIFGDSDSE